MRKNNKKILTADDLAKIRVGQQFSSKKELFQLMGLEWSSGHARASSMRTIDQYIKLDIKKKNSITIAEIYDRPKPRDDKRHTKAYGLSDEIDTLLYGLFRTYEKNTISTLRLSNLLGCFSNEMLYFLGADDNTLSKKHDIPPELIHLFKRNLNDCCRKWIVKRLKKTAAGGEIEFYSVIVCQDMYYDETTEVYAEYHRLRQELVEEMGYSKYSQAVFSLKNKTKFDTMFNDVLKNNGLKGSYPAFCLADVSFAPTNLLEDVEHAKKRINEFFCKKLQNQIFTIFDKENLKHYDERLDVAINNESPTVDDMKHRFVYNQSHRYMVNKLLNICLFSKEKLFAEGEKSVFYTPKNINE